MSATRRTRAAQRGGFTLIETMVAVTMALVVVGLIYSAFNTQTLRYVEQDQRLAMTQNVRFAVDILSRSVRNAGHGVGVGVSGPGGYDGAVTASATLPSIVSWDGGFGGSSDAADAITVVYADPDLVVLTAPPVGNPPNCATTTLAFEVRNLNTRTLLGTYEAGDLLMCWDYTDFTGTRSFMWELAAAPNTTTGIVTVQNNSAVYADYDASCPAGENLPALLTCSRAEIHTYYVDATSDGIGLGSEERPALMLDTQFNYGLTGPDNDDIPLVDGIEDLQVAYCPEELDCLDPVNWVADITAEQGLSVWMVRFSVVSRSEREDPAGTRLSRRPGLENRTEGSEDGYFREVITAEVTVRNHRVN